MATVNSKKFHKTPSGPGTLQALPRAKNKTVGVALAGTARNTTVSFGNVSVVVRAATDKETQAGIKKSTQAMRAFGKRLVSPGVTIRRQRDVPTFVADSDDPTLIVRTLNGDTVRGRFVNGDFRPISKGS